MIRYLEIDEILELHFWIIEDFGETIESSLKRELYEEVGYRGGLRYQLFDASDEMYIERIDANQICFYCRVWPENFDFIPGEEGDEIMFISEIVR